MSGGRRGGGHHVSGNGNAQKASNGSCWVEKGSTKTDKSVGKKQRAPSCSSNAAPIPTKAQQALNGNGSLRLSVNGRVQHSDHRPAARGSPRSMPQNKQTETKLQAPCPVVTDRRPAARGNPRSMSQNKHAETELQAPRPVVTAPPAHGLQWINEKTEKWHCPACKYVRGGVAWYKGLQPLMNHARTKRSKRVKLHREFAALLEEELYHRGVSMAPSGEFFGIWKGLRENTDLEIVWPPVIIIMNTRLEQDKDGKWKGIGNEELLGYFSKYHVREACHAYGPDGHSGMSALIFKGLAVAYKEAERLHNHFVDQRRDRGAWQNLRLVPGGKRQLYGFLAEKQDMEAFNRHDGKDYLQYEMKSYNEMVVTQLKQMSEDNLQLNYVKNEMVRTEQHSKEVEEILGVETQKLQQAIDDNIILKRKTNEMLLECEEQMNFNVKFYHEHIERLRKDTEEKENEFERLQQEALANAIECDIDSETRENTENCMLSEEQIQRIVDCQVKDVKEFEAEQDELIKAHEENKAKVKKEYMEKDVELEQELYAALTRLMEKHKPDIFQPSSS
uniref:XS domain-containing protein n=1 Tax=Leersia perrieri TaxID=77586 RepID=A0A0D9XXP9_9ORYZ